MPLGKKVSRKRSRDLLIFCIGYESSLGPFKFHQRYLALFENALDADGDVLMLRPDTLTGARLMAQAPGSSSSSSRCRCLLFGSATVTSSRVPPAKPPPLSSISLRPKPPPHSVSRRPANAVFPQLLLRILLLRCIHTCATCFQLPKT